MKPTQHYEKWTREQEDRVLELALAGHSLRQIALAAQRTDSAVLGRLEKLAEQRQHFIEATQLVAQHPISAEDFDALPEEDRLVLTLLGHGRSLREIADAVRQPESVVLGWLVRIGNGRRVFAAVVERLKGQTPSLSSHL